MDNALQSHINAVNLEYRLAQLAIIEFKETPIVQTRKGLIRKMSTVDYMGVYNDGHTGRGVAFDAKMCGSKTSIPLTDIRGHQLVFLKYFEAVGGKAFFLIHFYKLYEYKAYMTPIALVDKYFSSRKRQSIPIKEFKDAWLVPINDYLQLK
jgi:recombination protein U